MARTPAGISTGDCALRRDDEGAAMHRRQRQRKASNKTKQTLSVLSCLITSEYSLIMQNDDVVSAESATAVAIVVDSSSTQQQLRMAVAALVPRKRTHAKDPISMELQYYLFWDDKRLCTHLDSLLTRLAPLSVVHVASTERAQVSTYMYTL